MARYSKGATGEFSGKVGRVIGSNWRSTGYLMGLSKKSCKPRTELQPMKAIRYFADWNVKKGADNDWPGLLRRNGFHLNIKCSI